MKTKYLIHDAEGVVRRSITLPEGEDVQDQLVPGETAVEADLTYAPPSADEGPVVDPVIITA